MSPVDYSNTKWLISSRGINLLTIIIAHLLGLIYIYMISFHKIPTFLKNTISQIELIATLSFIETESVSSSNVRTDKIVY